MPNPQIVEKNGQKFIEAPGMGLIPVDELYADGMQDQSWLHKAGTFVKGVTPEITAGLASALKLSSPLAGMVLPPVVAGVTDVAKQYGETGDLRKVNYGDAAMRGASNIIPDMSENLLTKVAEKGGTAVGNVAKNTLLHGPKGGLMSGLLHTLGIATTSDVAGAAAPLKKAAGAALDPVLTHMLPGGVKVGTPEGLQMLKAQLTEMAMKGQNLDHPQFSALNDLITKVEGVVNSAGAPELARRAGVSMTGPHDISPLANTRLPDGTKLLSPEGLKALVAKSTRLENTPGTPKAHLDALDAMIAQVREAIQPTQVTPESFLSRINFPTTTDEAITAAARALKLKKIGRNLNYGLRSALGLSQGVLAEGSE